MYSPRWSAESDLKVVFLGPSGGGKTSLLSRLKYESFTLEVPTTVGADVHRCEVSLEDRNVSLEVWDTAGQDKYRSLSDSFYRGAGLCLLVFALDDLDSLSRLDSWVEELCLLVGVPSLEQLRTRLSLAVVGNKCDLQDRPLAVEVAAKKWCKEHGGLSLFLVSALSGENMDDMIAKTVEAALFVRRCVSEISFTAGSQLDDSPRLIPASVRPQRSSSQSRSFCPKPQCILL